MSIQEKVYGFLERLCNNLTDDKNGKAFSNKGEAKQSLWKRTLDFDPEDPAQEQNFRLYLEYHSNIIPYSTPHEVDWDYVSALSGFHLRHAQDELRKMREDPELFFLYLLETRDHTHEAVLRHPSNQRHPWRNVENNPEAVSEFQRQFQSFLRFLHLAVPYF